MGYPVGYPIFVERGLYAHCGITTNNGVIHIKKEGTRRVVSETSLDEFLGRGTVYYLQYRGNPKHTLQTAYELIELEGYDLMLWNCENFVEYCVTGVSSSGQVNNFILALSFVLFVIFISIYL